MRNVKTAESFHFSNQIASQKAAESVYTSKNPSIIAASNGKKSVAVMNRHKPPVMLKDMVKSKSIYDMVKPADLTTALVKYSKPGRFFKDASFDLNNKVELNSRVGGT